MTSVRKLLLLCTCLVALTIPASASAGLLTGLLGGSGSVGSILYVLDDLTDSLLVGQTALSADDCTDPAVSEPFAGSGDTADYFLVPGGDFGASTSPWTFQAGGVDGGVARLPVSGAAALSPKFCVGEEEPTMRLRTASAGSAPKLRVDALFAGNNGELRSDYVTTLSGAHGFAPSPVIRLGTNARAAAGQKIAIALVFTVQSGAWAIDDVYVDPFRSR